MRTITNAQYQLETVMPLARKVGCKCPFSKADFQDFIEHKWSHEENCPAPLYENLPNPGKLMETLRGGRA